MEEKISKDNIEVAVIADGVYRVYGTDEIQGVIARLMPTSMAPAVISRPG